MTMTRKRVMSVMNETIFRQSDSRWGSLPYPSSKSDVSSSGCGLCAVTHVAIEQPGKRKWTPKTLRKYFISNGYAVDGQGTRWEGITNALKHIGHTKVVRVWDDPMSKAWTELNKGDRIGVLLFGAGKGPDGTVWTASGHYIAFTGYKVDDKGLHWFFLKDSGGRHHDGWYSYEKSMKGCLPKMWIVRKTKASRLISRAYAYAWRTASGKKNAPYPKGRPKKAYKAALDKYFGKTRKWQDSAKKGASCDVFVATCIRAAGIDKSAPRGLGRSYFNKSPHFKIVKVNASTIRDGDIISINWKNGNPHWCMAWNGKVLEASLKGWYPKSTNTLKSRLSKVGKQSVIVYRVK